MNCGFGHVRNSLTTSQTVTLATSWTLNQRLSYLEPVHRTSDRDNQEVEVNMTTGRDTVTLSKKSPLFWATLFVPVAIIAIGINFILNPVGASTAYGIPIHDPTAFPFMWVKGIRDIFSGLVLLPFILRGDRRTTAILYTIAILIPFSDGLVILAQLGFAPPLSIHWGTALYMLVVAAFLLRTKDR
jgi:hypothetical protein